MANTKEPFIPQSDRPDVKIDLNKSVSELTVRDLHSILAAPEYLKFRKDSYKEYKEFYKEYAKDYIKEHAYEKFYDLQSFPGDPGGPVEGGIAGLVAHVGGLHKKIDELSNRVTELAKKK